jgi:3-oxoacyl-[acyl-carrier-protein] synthase-1
MVAQSRSDTVDCLNEAKINPASDIELIKLQAAGSPGTDLAEANALRQRISAKPMPPLLSLKPMRSATRWVPAALPNWHPARLPRRRPIPATAGFSRSRSGNCPVSAWLTAAPPISSAPCST